jgi:hypothetical protein
MTGDRLEYRKSIATGMPRGVSQLLNLQIAGKLANLDTPLEVACLCAQTEVPPCRKPKRISDCRSESA